MTCNEWYIPYNRLDTYLCIWYIFLTFVNNKTHHIIILRLKTTWEKETILKVFFCMLQKVHKKYITMTWNSMSNSTHLVPPQSGDINILYDTHYLIHVELSLRNENLDLLKTLLVLGCEGGPVIIVRTVYLMMVVPGGCTLD